jgi:MFS superfamily sulfate permease-like transporter
MSDTNLLRVGDLVPHFSGAKPSRGLELRQFLDRAAQSWVGDVRSLLCVPLQWIKNQRTGSCEDTIKELADDLRRKGRTLVICGAPAQPAGALRKARFAARLGHENICESVQSALNCAAVLVQKRAESPQA